VYLSAGVYLVWLGMKERKLGLDGWMAYHDCEDWRDPFWVCKRRRDDAGHVLLVDWAGKYIWGRKRMGYFVNNLISWEV
jgi:hypothetical protein